MQQPVSFRELTTFKVGGSVGTYVKVADAAEALRVVKACDARHEPLLIIGSGSNILPSDDDFPGTVLAFGEASITYEEANAEQVRVTASAGTNWDALVADTVKRDLWGLENLSAIPGTVGASPIQNIGAYGAEVSDIVEWVEAYDRSDATIRRMANAELDFEYRTSVFKKTPGRFVVLGAAFILSRTPTPNILYKDLTARFGEGASPSLIDIREAVREIRVGKFPDLSRHGTAGSFFLNPILRKEDARRFLARFPEATHFDGENGVKVSLAWILDHIAHAKGMREGGAFVWEQQPLVIATDAGATARDVRALAHALKEKVFDTTEIDITPEVTFL